MVISGIAALNPNSLFTFPCALSSDSLIYDVGSGPDIKTDIEWPGFVQTLWISECLKSNKDILSTQFNAGWLFSIELKGVN